MIGFTAPSFPNVPVISDAVAPALAVEPPVAVEPEFAIVPPFALTWPAAAAEVAPPAEWAGAAPPPVPAFACVALLAMDPPAAKLVGPPVAEWLPAIAITFPELDTLPPLPALAGLEFVVEDMSVEVPQLTTMPMVVNTTQASLRIIAAPFVRQRLTVARIIDDRAAVH